MRKRFQKVFFRIVVNEGFSSWAPKDILLKVDEEPTILPSDVVRAAIDPHYYTYNEPIGNDIRPKNSVHRRAEFHRFFRNVTERDSYIKVHFQTQK